MLNCQTCRELIPETNLAIHQIRCTRYNYYCSVCNQVIPKTEMEQHQTGHQTSECDNCNMTVENSQMSHHLENECLLRQVNCDDCGDSYRATEEHHCSIACDFCGEMIEIPSMPVHQESCYAAGKTESCEICGKRIQVRQLAEHHLLHERGEIPSDEEQEEMPSQIECPTCGEEFTDNDYLTAHRMEEHNWTPPIYQCFRCKATFLTDNDLELHRKFEDCSVVRQHRVVDESIISSDSE